MTKRLKGGQNKMNRKEVIDCLEHGFQLAGFLSQDESGAMFKADCGCTVGPVRLLVEVRPGVAKQARYKVETEEKKK